MPLPLSLQDTWEAISQDDVWYAQSGLLQAINAESSAIKYKTRISKEDSVEMECTVKAWGSIPDAGGQERYHAGVCLIAEDDPTMDYVTIQLARNVPPIPTSLYGHHLISMLFKGVHYTLLDPAVPGQTYVLKLRYDGTTKRVYAYINGSYKKSFLWTPTLDIYKELICVSVGAGESGPERASSDFGPLKWAVTHTESYSDNWT